MAIQFPSFEGTKRTGLTACGQLRDIAPEEAKKVLPKKDMSARFKDGASLAYARILGGQSRKHFHVDVISRSRFAHGAPKLTSKIADVRGVFSRLIGVNITTRIRAEYSVSPGDMRSKFSAVFARGKEDAEAQRPRVRSVEFSVDKSSLEFIRFSQPKVDGDIVIAVAAYADFTIDDDYLLRCIEVSDTVVAEVASNIKGDD